MIKSIVMGILLKFGKAIKMLKKSNAIISSVILFCMLLSVPVSADYNASKSSAAQAALPYTENQPALGDYILTATV